MARGETYEQFVEKHKPKRTTDDCITPEKVYTAVLDWAREEYKLGDARIVRPFWPGKDYLKADYPKGCVVVDNPPFSILNQIIKEYTQKGVQFFLFAPSLTMFSNNIDACFVVTDATITYENGAKINTSFITNLEAFKVRTAPRLRKAIQAAQRQDTKELPRYNYPPTVISAARLGRIAGVAFSVSNTRFVRALNHQRRNGKAIFGAGFFISEQKAAELKAAERLAEEQKAAEQNAAITWELTPEEEAIVAALTALEQ